MIKNLIKYANNIVKEKNLLETYQELIEIFNEECAYQASIRALDAAFFETGDVNILDTIGDIYKNKLNNMPEAENYFNKFLYLRNKDFYDKHSKMQNAIADFQIPYDINLVISRYRLVTEILSFLHGRKYYQEILNFKNNLKELYEKILDFIDEYDFSNSVNSNKRDAFELLKRVRSQFACTLANTENNNDINRMAIELHTENEGAYLNIIDTLVMNSDYEQALEIYNNEYIKVFTNNKPLEKIPQLCWFLSDKLYHIGQYFNAVERQKLAIDIELESRENNE